jgi:hypothetical protein
MPRGVLAALLCAWVFCSGGCKLLEDEFTILDRPPPKRDAAAAAEDARQ